VEKSAEVLAKEAITEERGIMQEFFRLLATEPARVAYGDVDVNKALEMGAVDKLLVSETLDDDKIEAYEDKAEASGATVVIISTDTSEGEQLRDIGKIAAILRFALH